jgi:hypothetical protein
MERGKTYQKDLKKKKKEFLEDYTEVASDKEKNSATCNFMEILKTPASEKRSTKEEDAKVKEMIAQVLKTLNVQCVWLDLELHLYRKLRCLSLESQPLIWQIS